ncbi:MAG: 16S rRNA (uracil(1498)-N(3))-methyltransferase [Gammaproteobacteria bacterium]|nr:16S rRNA (uracil(1498)-N(3))-methyltransferase [Gammaproteobacteria bacterium]MDH5799828.1 16S rRNA (uracil(1498)-N(3))-methyltransferase [Gammaproteobacteria bacterium]
MRIPRIFQEQSLAVGQSLICDAQAVQYLLRVLRLKPGDAVTVFNGDGAEYAGKISALEKREGCIQILQRHEVDLESPLRTVLVQGVSRGERMDYTIQKATELGISEIFPVTTERTGVNLQGERRERRRQHWQAIVTSACEQCGRNRVPLVHPVESLPSWVDRCQTLLQNELKLVLHQNAALSLRQMPRVFAPGVVLLVGPEGGLTQSDLAAVSPLGFESVALGPRILRTETAALTALAILQSLWGDLG